MIVSYWFAHRFDYRYLIDWIIVFCYSLRAWMRFVIIYRLVYCLEFRFIGYDMIDRWLTIDIYIRLFYWIRWVLHVRYLFLHFILSAFVLSFRIIVLYVVADYSEWRFLDDHDRNSIPNSLSFPSNVSPWLFNLYSVRINEWIHLNYLQLIFSLLIIYRY